MCKARQSFLGHRHFHIPPDLVVQPFVFHNSLEISRGYPHGMS